MAGISFSMGRAGPRGTAILAVLCLSNVLSGGATLARGIFFDRLAGEFSLNSTSTAAVFSITQMIGVVSTLAAGWLLRRNRSPQSFLAAVALCDGAGYALAAGSSGYAMLVFAHALLGVGLGSMVLPPLILRNWFPRHTGAALGFTMAGITLGGMVVTPLISAVVEGWGWRMGYAALAVPSLLLLAPLNLLVIRPGPEAGGGVQASACEAAPSLYRWTLARVAARPQFWLLLGARFLFIAGCFGFFLFFAPSLRSAGYPPEAAALAMAGVFFLASVSKLGFGLAADRRDASLLLSGALFAAALLLPLMIDLRQPVRLGLFVTLFGLIYSAPLVLFPVVLLDAFGSRHFTALCAIMNVVSVAASAAGPLLGGWLLDASGRSYPALYAAGSVVFAIAGALVLAASSGLVRNGRASASARQRGALRDRPSGI